MTPSNQTLIDTLTPAELRDSKEAYGVLNKHHIESTLNLEGALIEAKDGCRSPKEIVAVVAQALLNTGVLSLGERDYGSEQLFKYVYGAKIANKLGELRSLHKALTKNGFDTLEQGYNSQSDNYFAAKSYTCSKESFRSGATRTAAIDVILMQTQSFTFAVVMTQSFYDDEVGKLELVKLGDSNLSSEHLNEFLSLAASDKLTNDNKWTVLNDSVDYGVVATVELDKMTVEYLIDPKLVESILLQISHGACCVEVDLINQEPSE